MTQKFMEIETAGLEKVQRAIQTTATGDSAKSSQQAIRNIRNLIVPAKGIGRLANNTPKITRKLADSTIGIIPPPIFGAAKSVIYSLIVKQDAKTPQEYGAKFYGKFVREGTKAHDIKARLASVLAFKVGGIDAFAANVRHPGTSPNPYHLKTLREVSSQLNAIYRRMGANIAQKFR